MAFTIINLRPGVQFTPDAAAAFLRAEMQVLREFGRHIRVNSTYRAWAVQLAMFEAWNWYLRGGPYPGHSKAVHPSESFHVSGLAMDSDDWRIPRIVQILAENGFIRNRLYVKNEEHHFEYIQSRDKRYGEPINGGQSKPAKPAATPDPLPLEDEDMKIKFGHRKTGGDEWMIIHPSFANGFIVTTDENRAKAWSRMYKDGWNGKYDFDVNREDYIEIQNAAKEAANAWQS